MFDNIAGLAPILIGLFFVGLVVWRLSIELRERGKEAEKNGGKSQPQTSFRRRTIDSSSLEYYHLRQPLWLLTLSRIAVIIFFGLIVGLIAGVFNYFSTEHNLQAAFQHFLKISFWATIFIFFIIIIQNLPALFMIVFFRDFRLLLLGNRMQEEMEYDKSLKYFEKAVSIFPSEYGYYKAGLIKQKNGKYLAKNTNELDNHFYEALNFFTKSVNSKHPHFSTFRERSRMRNHLRDFNGAISDMEMARKLDKGEYYNYDGLKSEIYEKQGDTYEILGERNKAINQYSLALKLTPEPLILYQKRGDLKYWNKEYARAIRDYSRVVVHDGWSHLFYSSNYRLLVLHKVLGKFENYIELRKSIINQIKKDKADYMRKDLAQLLFERGDFQGALTIYNEITDFDTEILDKFNKAKNDFESFINNNSESENSFEIQFLKADSFEKFGQLKQALKQLEVASEYIENNNQRIKYHYYSGIYHYKLWDYDNALIAFEKARTFDKENEYLGLNHYIAGIKKDQANFEEALKVYLKYIGLRESKNLKIDDQMHHDIIDICIALRDYESALKYADILESDTDELYKHRTKEVSRIIEMRDNLMERKSSQIT